MKRPFLSGLIIVLVSTVLLAQGSDWPRFRGPDSNPVSAGKRLPKQWSKTENVEWFAEIPGRGWSSPVVTGDKVFLTSVTTEGKSKEPQTGTEFSNDFVAELSKQGLSEAEVLERVTARDIELPHEVTVQYWLYCLDIKTGAVIWKQEIHKGRPPSGRHRKNSFVSETPVTDGDRVYVYVGNMGLYAYTLDGKQVWRTPLEAHPIYLDFGTGGSAALHNNLLVILNDNEKDQFIAAFDKKTGKQVWRTARDLGEPNGPARSGWTTPYIWTNSVRTEIVTIGPATAVSYDLTGKERWRLSGMSIAPIPSPFAYGGLLYLDGGQGRGLFAVRPGASGDISLANDVRSNEYIVWSDPRAGTYLPTPVAYDGGLYVLTEKGIITRFDAKTGTVTYKDRLDREAGAFTSSPWAYDGHVFCLSEEGKTYVFTAGATFKLVHVNSLDEMAQATPAIAGDRLLIRTASWVYSIRQTKR
jgi:outer membrane protein assembly factor BamB